MPEVGQLGADINPHTKSWSGRDYTAYDRLCQPCLEGWVLWSIPTHGVDDYDLSEETKNELKGLLAEEAAKKAAAAAEQKRRQEAAAAAELKQRQEAAAAAAAAAQQARKKSIISKKDAAKSLNATKVIKKVSSKR